MTDTKNHYRLGTLALHAGQAGDAATHSSAVPIYATAAYHFTSPEHAADLYALRQAGNIYSRLTNPTNEVLEKRLTALDGGVGAVALASGQAAVSATMMTLAKAGQNIIPSASLYGGTYTLFARTLRKMGVEARFYNGDRPEEIAKLADADTRCVYVESMGNPRGDVPDFRKTADAAHAIGVPLVVDNTVTTPWLLRPVEHGADIVVYSTTKYIGGHGLHVGGAVVDGGTFDWAKNPQRWPEFATPDKAYRGMTFTEAFGRAAFISHVRTHWLYDVGACMSPFAAFLFLVGLETLHVRMPRHCENSLALAKFLESHPAVAWVSYAGLPSHPYHEMARKYLPNGAGGIVGFGIKGGRDAGVRFIKSVKLCSHMANIGDARTLVIHPASTTHQQMTDAQQRASGVNPEFIRLCVGIEDVADLQADLDQALRASQT